MGLLRKASAPGPLWLGGLLAGSAAGFLIRHLAVSETVSLTVCPLEAPARFSDLPRFLAAIGLKVLLLSILLLLLRRTPALVPTGALLLTYRGFAYGWVLAALSQPPLAVSLFLAVYLLENFLLLALLQALHAPRGRAFPWIGLWGALHTAAVILIFSP